jgi:hypothetical protein
MIAARQPDFNAVCEPLEQPAQNLGLFLSRSLGGEPNRGRARFSARSTPGEFLLIPYPCFAVSLSAGGHFPLAGFPAECPVWQAVHDN